MMSISAIATLLVCVALLTIGGFVVIGAGRSLAKRAFAVMCAGLASWIAANYLADADVAHSLLWTRVTFEAIVAALSAFLAFVWHFPKDAGVPRWRAMLFWAASLVMAVVAWLPAFVPEATVENGVSNVTRGPLYVVFVVYFLVFVAVPVAVLIRRVRAEHGLARARLKVVLAAVLVITVVGSTTNLILPLVLGSEEVAKYGTYSALLFAGIIGYAIVRQRLFNVRLAAARTLTYAFTLGTLALGFALVSFLLVDQLLGESVQAGRQLVYTGFLLLAVMVYRPLKVFFDRVTRRVFFQDLYDDKHVLAQLGDIAAHSPSSRALLSRSIRILDSVLHANFMVAYVLATEGDGLSAAAHTGHRPDFDEALLARLPHHTVTVAAELTGTRAELGEQLERAGVAVVLSLRPSGQGVGYILCGNKLNGGAYNHQDIDLLATASDGLGVAVQNALRYEQIAHFNQTLQQQIREATRELRFSNRKLKNLDEAKDDFMSMASHQLRTPLTSVKGYLSMVLEGDAGRLNPMQRQLLAQAFASSQRMVYLIGDFLNVSRLQTGKFSIERSPTSLSEIVLQEARQLEPTAASRDIRIECHVPSSFPVLELDEGKLRQAVMNFIDNAIFYSHPGGVIRVDLTRSAHDIALTVHDDGIGVPAHERHHLFTKFYRASNARAVRPDGTGVGLFMAKKVVVEHGGSIIFESTEGKGSTFGFRLPLNQPENSKH